MPSSNFLRRKTIPDLATKKSMPVTTNFAKGINTYKPNDSISENELHLAQNARFERIGEYKTRRGVSMLNRPIGEEVLLDTTADEYELVELSKLTADNCTLKIDPQEHKVIFSLSLTVVADSTKYGVLRADLKSSAEGKVLATACVAPEKINATTPTEVELIFSATPDASAGSYYVELSTQQGGARKFKVAVANGKLAGKLRGATKGKITSVFEANLSDSAGAQTDKSVIFTFAGDDAEDGYEKVYRYGEDGTLTTLGQVQTNGNPVRYSQDGGVVRCAFGKSPYALNGTEGWGLSAIETIDLESGVDLKISVSNILNGPADNLIYFDQSVNTQAVWTHPYTLQYAKEADYITSATINAWESDETEVTTTFAKSTLQAVSATLPVSAVAVGHLIVDETGEHYGEVKTISGNNITVKAVSHIATIIGSYDKFDSDYRQNFPAVNTGDPITGMFNLAGTIFVTTRRHKYAMTLSSDGYHLTSATSACTADGGAFSQEAIVCGSDRAYYANDQGIFLFDGYNETSITANTIQNIYDGIENKQALQMEFRENHLYVLFPSATEGEASIQLVYNTNLRLWESIDTDLYISALFARKSPSNRFICGHNRMGMLMLEDDSANQYADLCSPIHFELDTAYQHYDAPGQLKRVTKWRPEFTTVTNPYYVQCGYALDFTDDVKYAYSINLLDQVPRKEAYVWDEPSQFNTDARPAKMTTIPRIHDDFRRCQIRYQHIAAYEPVNFKTHTLTIQTQRIR